MKNEADITSQEAFCAAFCPSLWLLCNSILRPQSSEYTRLAHLDSETMLCVCVDWGVGLQRKKDPKTLANVIPAGVDSACARDYFVLDNSE